MPSYVLTAAITEKNGVFHALCVEADVKVEGKDVHEAKAKLVQAVQAHFADASEDDLDDHFDGDTFVTHFVAEFEDEYDAVFEMDLGDDDDEEEA